MRHQNAPMTAPVEALDKLLTRAIADDGIEGGQAWDMFRKRAKGLKGGRLLFVTEDYDNPLMHIVTDHERRIAELEAEVEGMTKTLGSIQRMAKRHL